MPRTEALDAAREEAWDVLRDLADWDGEGTPGHEEGRRIIATARRAAHRHGGRITRFYDAVTVIDPTGKSFPVAITAAWAARKANV